MNKFELIELGRALSKFVVGTEGNVSQRTKDGFIIKASGKSLKDVNNYSFVSCDQDGLALPGEEDKPSMEAGFHSVIYKKSDYNFIAHTHPVNLLKILCSEKHIINKFASKRLFPDQVVFNGLDSYILPYSTPGYELKELIRLYTPDPFPKLILLANHGIICCGHSVNEVINMTEICEKSAEIFLGCNHPNFLTEEQVNSILVHPDEIYRKQIV